MGGPFIDINDVDKGYKSLHGDGEFRRFALCRRLPKRIQTRYRSKREYGQPLLQMSAAMVGSEARTAAMVDSKARIEALLAPSPEASKKRIEALLSSSNLDAVFAGDRPVRVSDDGRVAPPPPCASPTTGSPRSDPASWTPKQTRRRALSVDASKRFVTSARRLVELRDDLAREETALRRSRSRARAAPAAAVSASPPLRRRPSLLRRRVVALVGPAGAGKTALAAALRGGDGAALRPTVGIDRAVVEVSGWANGAEILDAAGCGRFDESAAAGADVVLAVCRAGDAASLAAAAARLAACPAAAVKALVATARGGGDGPEGWRAAHERAAAAAGAAARRVDLGDAPACRACLAALVAADAAAADDGEDPAPATTELACYAVALVAILALS